MSMTTTATPQGLYIHIPFCKSRCIYCGFFSTTLLEMRAAYVTALCQEIELRCHGRIGTLYLGGGTPSQLSISQLGTLFDSISLKYPEIHDPSIEVTMECNPDDITEEMAAFLSASPVNRVSMGIQTFSDARLRFLGRRHDSRQACLAVNRLRSHGIDNISIDLMFGFPGETLAQWQSDLDVALSLGVDHISAYSLMYEEGTPLLQLLEQGKIKETDDDTYIKMYDLLVSRLQDAGYQHYEISNFALPGKASRHNSCYWNDVPYIGIGAGAHSYDRRHRQWNVSDLHQYIEAINRGAIPCKGEEITPDIHYNDTITTRLRTAEGIHLDQLKKEMGDRYFDYLITNAALSLEAGLLKMDQGRLCLTLDGIHVSDMVMSDLVIVDNDL